jgi:hypothetical protein
MNLPRLPTSSELAIHRVDLRLTIYVPLILRKGMTWSFSIDDCVDEWKKICGISSNNCPIDILWYGIESDALCEDLSSNLKLCIRGLNRNYIVGTIDIDSFGSQFDMAVRFHFESPIFNKYTNVTETYICCAIEPDFYDVRHHNYFYHNNCDLSNFYNLYYERTRFTSIFKNEYERKNNGSFNDHEIRSLSLNFQVLQCLWNNGRDLLKGILDVPEWIDVNRFDITDAYPTHVCPFDFHFREIDYYTWCDFSLWFIESVFNNAPVIAYEMVPFMLKAGGILLNCERGFCLKELLKTHDLEPGYPLNYKVEDSYYQNVESIMNLNDDFISVIIKRENTRKAALTFIFGCKDPKSTLSILYYKDISKLIGKYIWNTRFDNEWLEFENLRLSLIK